MLEINLDGTLQSKLDWAEAKKKATGKVLWNIDLGLFSGLPQPLSDPQQYQTLKLALDHFCETVWNPETTVGICIYKGPVCSDVEAEYLDLLSGYLPDGLDVYISLDTSAIVDPIEKARSVSKERFPHFKLIIDGQFESTASVGILLSAGKNELYHPLFEKLKEKPFRVIPEALLTTEWHGLDELHVVEEALTAQGKRMLLGFEAAGGMIFYY